MFKFPGEKLQVQGPKLMPGYGIKAIAGHLVASQAGMLENSKSHISIANNRKRYIPNIGDFVVGIIISKHSENYRVDIGGPLLASTDLLAFENASKRNRPNLAVGAVIYARLVSNDADFEPELECMNADGKSDVFGELSNGTVVTCSLRMASSLQKQDNIILQAVASIGEFEIVAGINGKVFVSSKLVKVQVLLAKLIQECHCRDVSSMKNIVAKEMAAFDRK